MAAAGPPAPAHRACAPRRFRGSGFVPPSGGLVCAGGSRKVPRGVGRRPVRGTFREGLPWRVISGPTLDLGITGRGPAPRPPFWAQGCCEQNSVACFSQLFFLISPALPSSDFSYLSCPEKMVIDGGICPRDCVLVKCIMAGWLAAIVTNGGQGSSLGEASGPRRPGGAPGEACISWTFQVEV